MLDDDEVSVAPQSAAGVDDPARARGAHVLTEPAQQQNPAARHRPGRRQSIGGPNPLRIAAVRGRCRNRLWDVRCRLRDVRCQLWDVRCGLRDVRCQLWDVRCRLWDVPCRRRRGQHRRGRLRCRVAVSARRRIGKWNGFAHAGHIPGAWVPNARRGCRLRFTGGAGIAGGLKKQHLPDRDTIVGADVVPLREGSIIEIMPPSDAIQRVLRANHVGCGLVRTAGCASADHHAAEPGDGERSREAHSE